MSNITMGTLYQLNQGAVSATGKQMTNAEIKKALKEVKQFFLNKKDSYFMLLCREQYDFTLFNIKYKENFDLQKAVQELKECLSNRGEIVSIDLTENMEAFEIWIKPNDTTAYVYYLFPYDTGVIEV